MYVVYLTSADKVWGFNEHDLQNMILFQLLFLAEFADGEGVAQVYQNEYCSRYHAPIQNTL
jgi:hypothetical protein